MKLNLALIIAIIVAVGLVALGFTAFQISTEKEKLYSELQSRTIRNGDEFFFRHLKSLTATDSFSLNDADSLISQFSFKGVTIYYNADSIEPLNNAAYTLIGPSSDFVKQAISADTSATNFIDANGKRLFEYIRIVKRDSLPSAAVVFYSDPGYVRNIINSIWMRNFIRWFLQALVISLVTLLIVRWGILSPVNKVIIWLKAATAGNPDHFKTAPRVRFLQPLYKEITKMAQAMHEAKAIAQEEARLRTAAESIWTPERLNEEMKLLLQNKKLVVVSNREPYMHIRSGKEINASCRQAEW